MDSAEHMPTQGQASAAQRSSAYIARQPIMTADESVVGYELLFRASLDERDATCPDENATAATIDTLSLMGQGVLCDGHSAFIDCTQQALFKECFALLPPEAVVPEIQDTVPPSQDTIRACQRLKEQGYKIALDDVVPNDRREKLVAHADFLKVNVRKLSREESASIVASYGGDHHHMLAQEVETRENFVVAKKLGFTHFQGRFFHQPESMRARQIPANQATYVRLLSAISKTEIDFAEIESLIKHEPALCYRLLRYLNSPLLGLSMPVSSVRHALNLLGQREAAKWIRMATTVVMGQNKSSDLVLSSLVRARFCELIAPKLKHCKADLFLMGMLSLMDAILAVPMGVVVEELSLDEAIKEQLLCAKTAKPTPLSPIYDLMVACPEGDWERVTRLAKQLDLSLCFLAESSNEAMRWAHEISTTGRSQ